MLTEVLLVLLTIGVIWIGYSLHLLVHRPREGEQTPRTLRAQKATRLSETWDALAAEAALLASDPQNERALNAAATKLSSALHANAPYLGSDAMRALLAYRAAVWAATKQAAAPPSFAAEAPELKTLLRSPLTSPVPEQEQEESVRTRREEFEWSPRREERDFGQSKATEPPREESPFRGISL
ncbi:MAG: hypothetical protein RBU37_17330 [Myxococcota bacterium]|jgi:hypothetical protein|nr:hypothetical protein [Myxococcota bacterium]